MILLKLYLWLDRRFADLPLSASPLPISPKPEHNEFAFVVETNCHGLSVELPHKGCVVGAVLRLFGGWWNHASATHLHVGENGSGLFGGSRNTRHHVRQASVRQIVQGDLLERLHQLAEVLHVGNESGSFARTFCYMRAVHCGNRANHPEKLLDHRNPLEKVPAVLLSSNSSRPVNRKSRKNSLGPRRCGRPPFDCLADQIERRAIHCISHIHVYHGRSLALSEGRA